MAIDSKNEGTGEGHSRTRLIITSAVLVAANLFPLAGVVFFDWEVFGVVMLYIAETVVVGLYNIPRILLARRMRAETSNADADRARADEAIEPGGYMSLFDRTSLAGFFLVHYGGFVAGQAFFVVLLLGQGQLGGEPSPLWQEWASGALTERSYPYIAGLAIFVLSHGYSFVAHYLRGGERDEATPNGEMERPYKRIFVQQFTVIFGAHIFAATGAGTWGFVAILVVAKTAIDLGNHLWEH